MNEKTCFTRGGVFIASALLLLCAAPSGAQEADPLALYQSLKKFDLSGGTASAENLVLKRDRGEITFASGRLYFEAPVAGQPRGAVFIGRGNFRAEVPNSPFERENVRRMLGADLVESDFTTAVLRFTDDTFEQIKKSVSIQPGSADPEALKLAAEFEPRLLKETSANISSRLAAAILNQETPGFFIGQFDKGRRGRFNLLLDHQGRLPLMAFGLSGGEKGVIFAYRRTLFGNDVWMAFYSLENYQQGRVQYTDAYDLVDVQRHTMRVDLREPKRSLTFETRMDMEVLANGTRAIPFFLNEALSEYDNERVKKALRVKSARLADGAALPVVQEEWEGAATVLLPEARKEKDKLAIVMELSGDFNCHTEDSDCPFFGPNMDCYFPRATTGWYPRHGYLNRSTYDMTFQHAKKYRVASVGARVREELSADGKEMTTQWKMEKPIALATFGMGPFERHAETRKVTDKMELAVEFYSLPGGVQAIKEDFILAELGNAVNYFHVLFGDYPYPRFGAMLFPSFFGQGFPSMLLLPQSDRASKYTYAFVAHETAHQWWGNIVAWRSYRDQWLSEGFAEYSGLLYTARRQNPGASRDLLDDMRRSLKDPPVTETGVGKGKLVDVGPIILGHRLSTRETFGAYQTLIYNKGGLVLRMLHFLFSDPATGDDKAFFEMMTDFVNRHRDGWATTESFRQVANEHIARTPLGKKYGLKDLNWFFRQWVYQTHLPTYRMEYAKQAQPDGTVLLTGTVFQDNAPEDWFMPLPLEMKFEGNQVARGTVHAQGPRTPFNIKLPRAPRSVELDPALWVLSEKTTTKAK